MRLVCPSCEAKYEVPEDAIPETGRDVQCANCGHAWYQMRPRAAVVETPPIAAPVAAPAAAPVAAPVPAPAPEPVVEAVPEPVPEPEVVAEVVAADVAAPEPEPEPPVAAEVVAAAPVSDAVEAAETAIEAVEAAASDVPAAATEVLEDLDDATDDGIDGSVAAQAAAAGAAAAASAPAAYAVDDSVLAILREEAERESQARRAETAKPLEVQEDLGIDTAMPAAARPVEPAVAEAPASAMAAANRTRLPDVEEIKSTLRPDEILVETGGGGVQDAPVEARSSFRRGFSLVIVIAILGAALYVSADSLKAAVPALTGVLDAYVGFVDSLRLQLDGLMQSATLAINGN